MRLFSRLLWISTFLLATYSWMVAFEHGFAWNQFRDGFKSEWRNVGALLMAQPQSVPAAQKPAADTPDRGTPSNQPK